MKLLVATFTMLLIPSTFRALAWVGCRYGARRNRRRQSVVLSQRPLISQPCLPMLSRIQSRSCSSTNADTKLYLSSRTPDRTLKEIKMTNDVQLIMKAAIQSVDPSVAVGRCFSVEVNDSCKAVIHVKAEKQSLNGKVDVSVVTSYELDRYESIVVVGIGKAAPAMVMAVLEPIFQMISSIARESQTQHLPQVQGLVLTKQGHISEAQRMFLESRDIAVRETSHPIPCEKGVAASNEILELVTSSTSKLVIVCVSGGGSALFCTPQSPLTLEDLKATNQALLQTGWPIASVNAVRKVLERRGKGGGLALAALSSSPTTDVVSLILSDVMGDPLDLIASGPTVLQNAAVLQANIQEAYTLVVKNPSMPQVKFPPSVVDLLNQEYESSSSGAFNDYAITDDFKHRCFNCLVGNNAMAVEAAALEAKSLGYFPVILGTQMQGEASTVAQVLVGLAQHLQRHPSAAHSITADGRFPVALIAGGETTVTLPSDDESLATGRLGGRNQELALSAALTLQEYQLRQVVVASVGTDGNDGPTDAAGAIVDGGTVTRLDAIASFSNGTLPSSSITAKLALSCHNAYPYLNQRDLTGNSPLLKVGTSEIK
jgi:glycerate 2-kinase